MARTLSVKACGLCQLPRRGELFSVVRPQPAPSTQKVLLPGISHTGAARLREFWDKCSYIQKCAPHRCCSAMKSTSMLFVIIPYSVRWCKLSGCKVRTKQVKSFNGATLSGRFASSSPERGSFSHLTESAYRAPPSGELAKPAGFD